jgi:signal transduction histidine kinase
MKYLAVLFAGLAMSTAALQAQASPSGVPESHRPPAGMCRIWIDGVPPAHQPAPTDCATAIRKRPMNARVVFGNEAPAGAARTFAPTQPRQSNLVAPSAPSRDDQAARAQQQREEQDRQRAAQLREEQERQRVEAQRQHDEQERRAARPTPPPTQHSQERTAPPPRPRVEKAQRPPRQSYSAHRPR